MIQSNLKQILKDKRIIIVQQSVEMGGAERQGLHLAVWLVKNCDAKVEYWGFQTWGQVALKCEESGIRCRLIKWEWRNGRWEMLKGFLKFAVVLRKAKPDILLPYTMPANIACGIAWRFSGAKTCIWNQRDSGMQRFDKYWEWLGMKLTPAFISNSIKCSNFLTK